MKISLKLEQLLRRYSRLKGVAESARRKRAYISDFGQIVYLFLPLFRNTRVCSMRGWRNIWGVGRFFGRFGDLKCSNALLGIKRYRILNLESRFGLSVLKNRGNDCPKFIVRGCTVLMEERLRSWLGKVVNLCSKMFRTRKSVEMIEPHPT